MKTKLTNVLAATSCLFVLSGCATTSGENGAQSGNADPLEGFNRGAYQFNEKFDNGIAKPVARAYVDYVPSFVQTGVGNFFGNISDAWTAVNSFLQGNVKEGFSDTMRFAMNSTFGLLGILDVATEAKIPKNHTDFGQTLGVWGVPNGPYLVIPFLGPSVMREAVGLPVDYTGDLWSYYKPVYVRNIGTGVRLVDKRAGYLDSYSLLEDAALDKYIFVRDAYIQRVGSQIESRKNIGKKRDEMEEQKQDDANAAKELNGKDKP